jgi:lysyl-tRNA synthetase class 2
VVSTEPPASPTSAQDDSGLPEQIRVRRAKRAEMLASGHDPYPVAVPRTHTLREVRAAHPDLPPDTATGDRVGVTGRVIFQRNTGKLCFATLREGDGTELQAMLSLARVGAEELARWKAEVDLGDHVFVEGEVITSKRGELSVMADGWAMAAKAVRPLPVAHRELNEETRVRQRYVDLIVRPQARDMVRTRAQVVRTLRSALHDRGFVEVETPMLQLQHGGATARPFVTHANRTRHRSVPADRAGAVPEAHGGRRHRARLRDQPQLPQRGHRLDALARSSRCSRHIRHTPPMTTLLHLLTIW